MRVKILGTGTYGARDRALTSFVVDGEILMDLGNGTVRQMQIGRIGVEKISRLVITHFHPDHWLDLPCFLFKRKIVGKGGAEKLIIVGPKGIRGEAVSMLQKYLGEFADFEKIEDEHNLEFVEDNYGIVRGFRVLHGKSTACNGYVIEIDGKKAGFSGDATKCEGLDGIVAESDVIFVDATSLKGDEDVHLGMSGCVEYALRYPEKKFYAVHRNDYDLPEDLPSNVFVPSDGEEVLI